MEKSERIFKALADASIYGMNVLAAADVRLREASAANALSPIRLRLSRVRAVRRLVSELGLSLPVSSIAQAQLLAVFAPATRVRRRAKFG